MTTAVQQKSSDEGERFHILVLIHLGLILSMILNLLQHAYDLPQSKASGHVCSFNDFSQTWS